MKKYHDFCDLSVPEKDWRAASPAFERMHNTLSHRVKIYASRRNSAFHSSASKYVICVCLFASLQMAPEMFRGKSYDGRFVGVLCFASFCVAVEHVLRKNQLTHMF